MTARLTIAICLILSALSIPAKAQNNKDAFRSTNYPLPRFVSLRSKETFARTGPGKQYPVRFSYKKRNIPVEITLEYESWRKIRDKDGDEGWVHSSLLSGKRTALVKGTENIPLRRKPKNDARKTAYLEPNVITIVDKCTGSWCKVSAAGYEGWIKQLYLWGIYDNESFD